MNGFLASLKRKEEATLKRLAEIRELIAEEEKAEEINGVPSEKKGRADHRIETDLGNNMTEIVLTILAKNKRFMKSSQIAEYMSSETNISLKECKIRVSNIVTDMARIGKIVRHSADFSNKRVYWGAHDWLDHNGKIILKHMYL